jgi:tRNA(fMet)-specific endonuclease VapC
LIHLDTSFLVDLLRGGSRAEPAQALLAELGDEELGVSIHVVCELSAGAELARDPEAERTRMLSLVEPLAWAQPDERFPRIYAELLAALRHRGEQIATMDLLIATAAVCHDAPLVTRNVKDFERVPGLRVLSY